MTETVSEFLDLQIKGFLIGDPKILVHDEHSCVN
jgi:hypothetical protein